MLSPPRAHPHPPVTTTTCPHPQILSVSTRPLPPASRPPVGPPPRPRREGSSHPLADPSRRGTQPCTITATRGLRPGVAPPSPASPAAPGATAVAPPPGPSPHGRLNVRLLTFSCWFPLTFPCVFSTDIFMRLYF